ncbi:MAG TPA: DUF952 domain-containing protein [Planctomycetota bacterium]|nr:DUF952 domain-containing protein [Planctomycetota bacterium]
MTTAGRPASPGGEGFVHCSFGRQVPGTLHLHFPQAAEVTLLRLDPAALGERLKLEASRGGELFPHVYGEIEGDDVVDRLVLRRREDGRFDLTDLLE